MVYDVNDYDIAIASLMTIGRRFGGKCQSAVVSYLNTNIRTLLFQRRSLFFICKVEPPPIIIGMIAIKIFIFS